MTHRLLYLALGAVSLSAACSKKAEKKPDEVVSAPANVEVPSTKTSRAQWYRIVMAADEGDLPFMLQVQLPLQPSSRAVVANGVERIALEMTCEGTACEVHFPVFAAALRLTFEGEQKVVGHWQRSKYVPKEQVPLTGVAVAGPQSKHRYVEGKPPTANIGGKWVLEIEESGPGKAEFVQAEDGTVQGSLVPTNLGDVRYLDGRVEGNRAHLSTFDGQHAYNIELTVSEDGKTLDGIWHNHATWDYEFLGWRGEEPGLDDLHTIRLKPGKKRVGMPEIEALRGKPAIIDLYGTWCPACIDLMPALVDLHKRYGPQGLHIRSIAFEPLEDPELAKHQVALFEEKYGIEWESSIRDLAELQGALVNLDHADGFPITIFVDRNGEVRGLHSGFISAAAGEDHKRLLAKYEALTKEILASKANDAP